ncbi:MAG: hypothetical protein C4575_07075 [Desulforudis sp.]|nr:MAG: hypothetical protein C4575_07075 [Desulforudis sp.]
MLYLPFVGGVVGTGVFCALTQQAPDSMQQTLQAAHGASAAVGAVAAGLVGWVSKKTNQKEGASMRSAEEMTRAFRTEHWGKPKVEEQSTGDEPIAEPAAGEKAEGVLADEPSWVDADKERGDAGEASGAGEHADGNPEEALGVQEGLDPDGQKAVDERAGNPQGDLEEDHARVDPASPAVGRNLEQVRESLRMAQMLVEEIEKGERSWRDVLVKLQAAEETMRDCATAADELVGKFGKAQSLLNELSAVVRERQP